MSQTTVKEYETVIGLEVHLQLKTNTKIFCHCENSFGAKPNDHTCPVCLGLPGTLPVLNEKVLAYSLKVALALNCKINSLIKFDRKNYYYPDLPKGYQISQFDKPIAYDGFIMINKEGEDDKKIGITRAHMEEDAGKLIHDDALNSSLVDYNRTGTPLLEIVTEPDMRSSQEAYDYLNRLKLTLSYLDVSDCDMEKGSLRCDANISIREKGATKLGTKTELKNMNSFKAVKQGLDYEIARHTQIISSGGSIVQETLLWNEQKQMTVTMRSKEEAHDYRYFPEPDLVPFMIDAAVIESVKEALPELPMEKLERFKSDYKLNDYDATIIIQDCSVADFFEKCTKHYKDSKKISNWLNGAVLSELNDRKLSIDQIKLAPEHLCELISKVDDGVLSNLAAKDALKHMIDSGKSAAQIIEEQGLAQVSDEGELETIIDALIQENEDVANQVREGKQSAVGFLVGQAMKKTQGKANPKKINELLTRRLMDE